MAGDIGIWQDELGPAPGDRGRARPPRPRRAWSRTDWARRLLVPAGSAGQRRTAWALTVLGAAALAAS
ncbi:hypothetical protein ACFQX7_20785 [Luedemannella flava]